VIPHIWKLPEFREITSRWQREMIQANAWNAIYLENHDQARMISRYGSDLPEFSKSMFGPSLLVRSLLISRSIDLPQGPSRERCSRCISRHSAVPSLSIKVSLDVVAKPGSSRSYTSLSLTGQELGQINAGLDWPIEEYKDVGSINLYADHLEKRRTEQGKDEVDMSDVMLALKNKARDHARVPVHWGEDEHAGHKAKPWMRMHADYKEWNAATQAKNPKSVLNFYKTMFKVRKDNDVLVSVPSAPLVPSTRSADPLPFSPLLSCRFTVTTTTCLQTSQSSCLSTGGTWTAAPLS
jgi:oligo-1,6-glucosidase